MGGPLLTTPIERSMIYAGVYAATNGGLYWSQKFMLTKKAETSTKPTEHTPKRQSLHQNTFKRLKPDTGRERCSDDFFSFAPFLLAAGSSSGKHCSSGGPGRAQVHFPTSLAYQHIKTRISEMLCQHAVEKQRAARQSAEMFCQHAMEKQRPAWQSRS